MPTLLSAKQIERINASPLRDHPLMAVCRKAFDRYKEEMEHPIVRPEHLFYEAALLIDELIDSPDADELMLQSWWSDAVTKLNNSQQQPTPDERYQVLAAVFRTVAVTLSLHTKRLYCDQLRELLLDVAESKMQQRCQDPVRLLVAQDEWHRVVVDQASGAEVLGEWINNYTHDGGEWLSDVVERVAEGGPYDPVVAKVKPIIVRKPLDTDNIQDSFTYCAKGVSDPAARLQQFFDALKGRYIAKETVEKDFIDMFLGKTTTYKATWIADIKELKYLFLKLYNGLVTHKHHKWEAVCARFQLLAKVKPDDADVTNDKLQFQIVKLTSEHFNTHAPKKHEGLDKIVRILDPKTKPQQALSDFLDYWKEQTKEDEPKDDDFAMSNGLYVSDHPY